MASNAARTGGTALTYGFCGSTSLIAMLDPALRRSKDRLLEPLARALGPGVHPNALTLLGFALGLGCAWSLLHAAYLPALGLWALNRVLDGLDGAVARIWDRQSDLGGYLDILLDFALYALIPLALVAGLPDPDALYPRLALLLGSFYLNAASWMYLAALLEKRAAARRDPATAVVMPAGLIEGTETLAFYTAFLLLPGALPELFAAMTALVLLTVAQRLLWAVRVL